MLLPMLDSQHPKSLKASVLLMKVSRWCSFFKFGDQQASFVLPISGSLFQLFGEFDEDCIF
jgi:hypothetical protein